MSIKDFKGTTPEFLPEVFFNGRHEAWGIVESLVGGLQRRCSISAEGKYDATNRSVTFNETYHFDDGHSDTLNWTIRKVGDHIYHGSETRLEGPAEGERHGCAFHWKYTRNTPQADGSESKLNYDDWFYLIKPEVCIVRGSAGRAGLPFGTVHVTYRKIG